jgi:hypothetical protein
MLKKRSIVILAVIIIIIIGAIGYNLLSRKTPAPSKPAEKAVKGEIEEAVPVSGRIRVLPINDEMEAIFLEDGKIFSDHEYLNQYGRSSAQILKDYPAILSRIRAIKPDFSLNNVATSYPSKAAWLKDGREFLLLSGCGPQSSYGTMHVIAYEPKKKSAFLVRENSTRTRLTIYGDPDKAVQTLLIYYFFHQ